MQDLPSDLLKKIGSYCPVESAVCLSRLSKGLHEVLSLSTAEWELWRNERHWLGGYRDVRTFVEPIPIVLPRHLVQSVRLCCTWKDQTWGNRKGVLFVSTSDKHLTDDSIVAQSGIAEHTETALKIEFHPKEGENYYLWRYVGGGGGHELKVRNMRVCFLLFDTPGRHYARNLAALVANGATESMFGINSLVPITQTLLNDINNSSYHCLCKYLEGLGIEVTMSSLAALLNLVQSTELCKAIQCKQESTRNQSLVNDSRVRWG